ncbi:hypothetical protein NKE62_02860 [Akkermansia sp. Marseille-P9185]|uniref:hypothetical protein n=1 Tax=Akkermansia massiliensis TaxID=2927224 RepID=UPI00209BC502|nr:hypothetical protein [Akkermansia massiliensis]MCO8185852.1 hypothetical protein [Akkermansia massiliensis]
MKMVNSEDIKLERLAENEFQVIDPITSGRWKIVASHPLSEEGALIAISQVLLTQDIRPKLGATLTVNFSIQIQKPGEKISPFFQVLLEEELQ